MRRGITGRYETTAVGGEGIEAFVPAPLPPSPPLARDGRLQQLLERAHLALGRLDSLSTLLPSTDLLLYAYVRKEAVLSSRIEGTQSSLSDLLLFELDEAPGVPLDDVQFETIHPFLDGNGRMGRLLITFLLCHAGVLREPLLYLSLYFKQHRDEYYDLLGQIRTDGDWEAWLAYFLEGVRETAEGAVTTARRLTDLFGADRDRILPAGRRAGSLLRVHDSLKARPVTSLPEVVRATGLTAPTVGSAMEGLVSLGVARELTGKRRNRVFAYDRYLAVLNEGTEGR